MLGYCRKTCAALLLILFAGYWLRHALPACPPCRWLRHRSLAPLLRRCQRHRTSEPYAPAVSAHRPSFAAGDGCRRGPLVCGTAAWRTLRVPHDASGRLSPAGHPHLLAAGASRVLNRLCVHKDCTSLRRPGPRKDDVSFIHSVTRTQSDEKTFLRSALCTPPCRDVSRCGTRRPCR